MKTMRSLKWLRPLLVVLFMSYYVGGTAFTHTHHFLTYSILTLIPICREPMACLIMSIVR